jgi:hypothetical protein
MLPTPLRPCVGPLGALRTIWASFHGRFTTEPLWRIINPAQRKLAHTSSKAIEVYASRLITWFSGFSLGRGFRVGHLPNIAG